MTVLEIPVIDMSGDTKIMWDSDKPAEVEAARDTFNKLRGQGYTAHRLAGEHGQKKGQRVTEFDATAEGIVMVPAMTAG